jgi:hypothetical protein
VAGSTFLLCYNDVMLMFCLIGGGVWSVVILDELSIIEMNLVLV